MKWYLQNVVISDIALIKNNAHVAAQISVELSRIKCGNNDGNKTSYVPSDCGAPVVIGGSILDMCCIVDDNPIKVSIMCIMYLEIN